MVTAEEYPRSAGKELIPTPMRAEIVLKTCNVFRAKNLIALINPAFVLLLEEVTHGHLIVVLDQVDRRFRGIIDRLLQQCGPKLCGVVCHETLPNKP